MADMNETNTTGSLAKEQTFNFSCWTVTVRKSHILQSRCNSLSNCEAAKLNGPVLNSDSLCTLCKYEKELSLPQLPEMTFASNLLKIEHKDGFGIEFNCLDALQKVDSKNDLMKVAVAEAWQESRSENSSIKDIVKPFDWTYSTDYKGTLFSADKSMKMSETNEKIDIEKLKVKERILFYEDIILFEDELADNGTAQCSVKIRVMPDSFFILQRYFLRVDNLYTRINDTRIYHEVDKSYILREYTNKESKVEELKVHPSLFLNPPELSNHLPTKKFSYEKIEFPS